MNTGLTDAEKESLLKFFLTHCVLTQLDKDGYNYEVQFFNSSEKITKDTAITIGKAMDNLRKGALPWILMLTKGEL